MHMETSRLVNKIFTAHLVEHPTGNRNWLGFESSRRTQILSLSHAHEKGIVHLSLILIIYTFAFRPPGHHLIIHDGIASYDCACHSTVVKPIYYFYVIHKLFSVKLLHLTLFK